LNILNK